MDKAYELAEEVQDLKMKEGDAQAVAQCVSLIVAGVTCLMFIVGARVAVRLMLRLVREILMNDETG